MVLRDASRQPHLVLSTARDVTERQRIEEAVKAERQHLYEAFMQAPASIAVLRGPDHVFELANPRYQRFIDQRPIVDKPYREARREMVGQGFHSLLDEVYRTGQPFTGVEMPVKLDRSGDGSLEEAFFNFVYQPIRNHSGDVDGILVHSIEVTEHVLARRRVEESEA